MVVKNLERAGYLSVLFDAVLFKDVVKRHKIRYSEQIGNLGSYLMNNVANLYSFRRMSVALGFRSGVTLEKYLRFLIDAYLVFSLPKYLPKTLERIKSPRKIYAVDNGFISSLAVQHSQDLGKLLENLVFTELVKRGLQPGHDLFYYKTHNNREIDFLIKEGIEITKLIQVAYNINDNAVRERETKSLLEGEKEFKSREMTVITWDKEAKEELNGNTVFFIPFWKWASGNF